MADGFLGRWAKRKEAVRKGEAVPAEPEQPPSPQPSRHPATPEGAAGIPTAASGRGSQEAAGALPAVAPPALRGEGRDEGRPAEAAPPPPTLEDVRALTPDSDFTRFARPDVAPEVKNAAFRKLFSDPHFNVMDGLDTYIDDYGKPDPIPPEMLKSLVSGKFLGLFDEKKEEPGPAAEEEAAPAAGPAQAAAPRDDADDPTGENVAQSGSLAGPALPPAEQHADPDLRLQQDDAPGPEGPGAGSR